MSYIERQEMSVSNAIATITRWAAEKILDAAINGQVTIEIENATKNGTYDGLFNTIIIEPPRR